MSDTPKKVISPKAIPKGLSKTIEKKTVVYVGPDLPGIKRYTIFNNGLPETLKKRIKEKAVFKELIVPVERLAEVNAEFEKPGSAFNMLYQKACE